MCFRIEQHLLDTNAGKQLAYAPTDVKLTLALKKMNYIYIKNRTLTPRLLKVRVNVGIQTIVYILKVLLCH